MSDDNVTAQKEHSMKIHPAMIAIMRDCEHIAKARKNQQQGFMFRGIDDVYNALHRVFAKRGVFTTSEILAEERTERQTAKGGTLLFVVLKIRFHFHAEDGSSIATEVVGEGMDSGDKATNKAMSIAHKYALLQALMIPTEDMPDPDAESIPDVAPASPEMQKEIDACLQAAKTATTQDEIKKLHAEAKANGFADYVHHGLKARYKELAP